jgi:hypothetical protein
MAMNLLERYLQAVGQYLPAATKDDTIAELRANLLDQMDAREQELGRLLVESDVAEMLKAHGKPEAVALRYLPQQSLIGPTVYPFYRFTIKRVLPLILFFCTLAAGMQFITTSHASAAREVLRLAGSIVWSTLSSVAILTLVFAGIEWALQHGYFKKKFTEWNPLELPAVKSHLKVDDFVKPFWKRVIDLTFHCVWIAYVLWMPWHPFWIIGPGVFYLDKLGVTFAPVWHTFYVFLLALLLTQLLARVLAFSRGAQTWLQPLELAAHVFGLVALGVLVAIPVYFVATGTGADPNKLAAVNESVGLSLRIALLFSLIGFAKQAWQYVKGWKPMKQFAF